MQLTAKILAIYFVLGSFLPKTDFSQLTKIYEMVEHYELHTLEANIEGMTYNFLNFLYDHFVNSDEHTHGDENSHQNLPFKVINSLITFISNHFDFSGFSFSPVLSSQPKFVTNLHLTGFFSALFHPPIV